MKVSELSQRSGVPLPTIKFYIREGLLSPGLRTAKNQAEYGASHLERLALIRALRDDAGLGVETIAVALKAADAAKENFIVAAIDALARPSGPPVDSRSPALKQALQGVLSLIQTRGWDLDAKDTCVREAARALAVIGRSFPEETVSSLAPYADAVERIAECEIPEDWTPQASPEAALRYAVLGTVLFEPLILALRRMAHVARARKFEKARVQVRKGKPRGR